MKLVGCAKHFQFMNGNEGWNITCLHPKEDTPTCRCKCKHEEVMFKKNEVN